MAADLVSDLLKTRVLKAHVDAVLEVFDAANAAYKATGDMTVAAKVIAEAVVTATDDKTRYVVIVESIVYGPYASWAAASKAIDSGYVGIKEGAKGYIAALVPSPKKTKGKK